MIRSRNIPPLLSRITGDGINAALLVTADGELLGSSSDAAAPSAADQLPEDPASGPNPNAPSDQLDYAAIGALVAEVAADYHRLGTELNHLDPRAAQQQAPPPPPSGAAAAAASPTGIGSAPASAATSPSSTAGSGTVASSKTGNNKGQENALRCMIVELDGGTIGVSSAGSDCYVVAMADTNVEHGMLRARLTALSGHVAEAFSQL